MSELIFVVSLNFNFSMILRIGEAVVKDIDEKGTLGEETAQSAAIVGSRWIGAFAGAAVGNKVGTIAGTNLLT